jgi:hypothetical protein
MDTSEKVKMLHFWAILAQGLISPNVYQIPNIEFPPIPVMKHTYSF